jgi:hypothetical protein
MLQIASLMHLLTISADSEEYIRPKEMAATGMIGVGSGPEVFLAVALIED